MISLTVLSLDAAVIGGGTYLTQQVACDYTAAVLSVQLLLNASVFGVAPAVASAAVLASGQQPWSMGSLSGGCRAGPKFTGRLRQWVWAALYNIAPPLLLWSIISIGCSMQSTLCKCLGPLKRQVLLQQAKRMLLTTKPCPQHTPAHA